MTALWISHRTGD